METPGQRFHYWITKVVGISVVEMASRIGVEHRTLYNVINNQNVTIIGKKTLTLLKQRFPSFPWLWIREGIGKKPDASTAEMVDLPVVANDEIRVKNEEITLLRSKVEELGEQLKISETNGNRLESLIVHFENMCKYYESEFRRCKEEFEEYKKKNN